MTLPGTLTEHTAENLSGMVMAQLINPGTPVLYGGGAIVLEGPIVVIEYCLHLGQHFIKNMNVLLGASPHIQWCLCADCLTTSFGGI